MALLFSEEPVIRDGETALDIMMSATYGTDCLGIALNKEALSPEFFDLSSRLAGDILQKFVNYGFKISIYGDLSAYPSKALGDFVYESNSGNQVGFVSSEGEAVERLFR